MRYTDKFDKLESHIMKELGFTYKEFRQYFPRFYELRREAELKDIGRRTRLVVLQVRKKIKKDAPTEQ